MEITALGYYLVRQASRELRQVSEQIRKEVEKEKNDVVMGSYLKIVESEMNEYGQIMLLCKGEVHGEYANEEML